MLVLPNQEALLDHIATEMVRALRAAVRLLPRRAPTRLPPQGKIGPGSPDAAVPPPPLDGRRHGGHG